MHHNNEPGHQPYQVCLVIVFWFFSGYVSLCVHNFTLSELDSWWVWVGDYLPIHNHSRWLLALLTFEQTLSNNRESNWISLLFKIIYKRKLLNVFTFYQYDAQQKKIHLLHRTLEINLFLPDTFILFHTDIFNSCPMTLCGISTENFSASMIFTLKKNS